MRKIERWLAVCLVAAMLLFSGPGAFAAGTTTSTSPGATKLELLRDILRERPNRRPVGVPEPATLTMVIAGLAGVATLRRRKRD